MSIALISGSGFYQLPDMVEPEFLTVDTAYGAVSAARGRWQQHELVFLARHGAGHTHLSHQINHRAHLAACQALGVEAIVACSVAGVVNPRLPLGQLLLPTELYFPDNRLPDGTPCTIFDRPGASGRGHLIAEAHFNAGLIAQLKAAASPLPHATGLVYGHVQGPRLNSRPEVRALAACGVDLISQTLGPEAVLAGELEIPYAALCYGTDYANGAQPIPTPIEAIKAHVKAARPQFIEVVARMLENWQPASFEGSVYRFD